MAHELEIIELRAELERVKLLLQNCNGDIIRVDRQLKEERNRAIEECIVHLGNLFPEYGPKEFSILEIRKELSVLKK